jgi:hypothetical protein
MRRDDQLPPADVHDRYGRPMFLAQTGIEGDVRPAWFRVVGHEVAQARQAGEYGGSCSGHPAPNRAMP